MRLFTLKLRFPPGKSIKDYNSKAKVHYAYLAITLLFFRVNSSGISFFKIIKWPVYDCQLGKGKNRSQFFSLPGQTKAWVDLGGGATDAHPPFSLVAHLTFCSVTKHKYETCRLPRRLIIIFKENLNTQERKRWASRRKSDSKNTRNVRSIKISSLICHVLA